MNGTNWASRKNSYYAQWRKNRNQQNAPSQPAPTPQQVNQQNSQQMQMNRGYSGTASKQTTQGSLKGVYEPGYDADGNQAVTKWQGQTEDKATRFLAKVHNDIDYNNYPDGYGFYEGDYQKFSLALGLNAKPQVMPDAQFDKMVAQYGLQTIYRGEAGQAQVDRFMNADYSHTGVGSYGDGFYFSDRASTANDYADYKGGKNGRVMKMALSPTARIITYDALRREMAKAGYAFQSALHKQGHSATSSYLNEGEAQFAIKLGYNVVSNCGFMGSDYHYALTRDAFIVSDKVKHKW